MISPTRTALVLYGSLLWMCPGAASNPAPSPALRGPHGDVYLSEFVASNRDGLEDEDGQTSDWIEIWNSGANPVDLDGWYLSDNAGDLVQWRMPTTVLTPGTGIVVFASGKDRDKGELHTNFKLSQTGEDLCLTRPDGVTVESSYLAFPLQSTDISFGLKDTTGGEGFFSPPSPGQPNGDRFAELAPLQVSQERGHQTQPFSLQLAHPHAAAIIEFTLDGSHPGAGNASTYTGPIQVSTTTTLRAWAKVTQMAPSPVATSTFLFSADVLAQSDARALANGFPAEWIEEDGTNWDQGGTRPGAWYGLDPAVLAAFSTAQLEQALQAIPSVSVTMDRADWFGDGSTGPVAGIYSNSDRIGKDWQRAASLEWFGDDELQPFQIDCRASIQGASSTVPAIRNQLSILLSFNGNYGPRKLKANLFDGSIQSFDHILLEAGNQNAPNSKTSTKNKIHAQGLRDQFISDVQNDMDDLAPQGRPAHVYLNGLYWGVYNIHERINEQFASGNGGGSPSEYDYVKEGALQEGNSNDWNDPYAPGAWKTAVAIAANGLDTSDMWQGQSAYEEFGQWFDVGSYARYLLLNYFGGNTDWPQNNWRGTSHSRLSGDFTDTNPEGVFRWHSWDAETVLHWGGAATSVGDGFYDRTDRTSTWIGDITYFYNYLRVNAEWRMLFADLAHKELFHGALYVDPDFTTPGTIYDPTYPERNAPATLYYRRANEIWPAIILEYARWGNYWHSPGAVMPSDWIVERDRLLNNYFPMRSGVLLAQLRNVQPQLYPTIDAPLLSQYGGAVSSQTAISLSTPTGATTYYTLDGSDPRLEGGVLNPSALVYSAPFTLTGPTRSVLARSFDGSEWSALERGDFIVDISVRINELQASNKNTLLDEAGESDDWAELINTQAADVDLSGWALSDDGSRPDKWRFPPGTVVPAKGMLLVWLDEDQSQGPLHANFKLSANGEELHLSGPPNTGTLLIDSVTFGPIGQDRSLGRMPNGEGPFCPLPQATPLQPNRWAGNGAE